MKKELKAYVKKATKQDRTFYNIIVEVDGMTFEVESKFLNQKQKALLRHKLSKMFEDDKNGNK